MCMCERERERTVLSLVTEMGRDGAWAFVSAQLRLRLTCLRTTLPRGARTPAGPPGDTLQAPLVLGTLGLPARSRTLRALPRAGGLVWVPSGSAPLPAPRGEEAPGQPPSFMHRALDSVAPAQPPAAGPWDSASGPRRLSSSGSLGGSGDDIHSRRLLCGLCPCHPQEGDGSEMRSARRASCEACPLRAGTAAHPVGSVPGVWSRGRCADRIFPAKPSPDSPTPLAGSQHSSPALHPSLPGGRRFLSPPGWWPAFLTKRRRSAQADSAFREPGF